MSLAELLLKNTAVDGEEEEDEEEEEESTSEVVEEVAPSPQPTLPSSLASNFTASSVVVDGEEEETEEELEEEELPAAVLATVNAQSGALPSKPPPGFRTRTERLLAQKNERIRKAMATLYSGGLHSYLSDMKTNATMLDASLSAVQDLSTHLREFNDDILQICGKLDVAIGFGTLNQEVEAVSGTNL